MAIKQLTDIIESPAVELGTTILDSVQNVPLGGIFVSIYKLKVGIADYLLCKKFAHFLYPMNGMEDEVDEYLETMQAEEMEKLAEYLFSLLSNAESSDKSQLMGYIFKSAVHGDIDHAMMLRLVSIIGRSFVSDLKDLPLYITPNDDFTIATNEFVNLGLIDNETGGYWKDAPTMELNEVGKTLYKILSKEGWFNQ